MGQRLPKPTEEAAGNLNSCITSENIESGSKNFPTRTSSRPVWWIWPNFKEINTNLTQTLLKIEEGIFLNSVYEASTNQIPKPKTLLKKRTIEYTSGIQIANIWNTF